MTVYRGTVTRVTADGVFVAVPALGGGSHEFGPLKYNGAAWAPNTMSLNDLSDVTIASPSTNQALTFNGTQWVNSTPASSIATLTDVTLSGLADKDVLQYNAGTSKWLNKTLWNAIISAIYPIGAIWCTIGSDDPNTIFGGTWVKLDGVYLAAAGATFGAVNTTIGAASATLAIGNIPSHSHGTSALTIGSEAAHTHATGTYAIANESAHTHSISITSGTQSANHTHTIGADNDTASGSFGFSVHRGAGSGGFQSNASSTESATHTHSVSGTSAAGSAHNHTMSGSSAAGSSHNHSVSGSTDTAGSGSPTAVPTLSPALLVYMWRRTA